MGTDLKDYQAQPLRSVLTGCERFWTSCKPLTIAIGTAIPIEIPIAVPIGIGIEIAIEIATGYQIRTWNRNWGRNWDCDPNCDSNCNCGCDSNWNWNPWNSVKALEFNGIHVLPCILWYGSRTDWNYDRAESDEVDANGSGKRF